MRKLSEVGLNDEEAAILREFITAVIIFMRENSCQALLSWKQRQRARDFWQTPFPCAQKHRALPPADTSSQFMKNNTNMSLCITAQNSWFTFRVKRTLRSLTKKKLVTQCFFFFFFFSLLGNERRKSNNAPGEWKKKKMRTLRVSGFRSTQKALVHMPGVVLDLLYLWYISTNISSRFVSGQGVLRRWWLQSLVTGQGELFTNPP